MIKKTYIAREDNTLRVQFVQALRQSGAAGAHNNKKNKRNRTRQTQKNKALDEQQEMSV